MPNTESMLPTIYDDNNIFARIIRGEIPAKKFYEDKQVLAFYDIAPQTPIHLIIIPKGRYISFDDFVRTASPELISYFFIKVQAIAEQLGLPSNGYRIIANHGKDANQQVPHFHVHLLGGKKLDHC